MYRCRYPRLHEAYPHLHAASCSVYCRSIPFSWIGSERYLKCDIGGLKVLGGQRGQERGVLRRRRRGRRWRAAAGALPAALVPQRHLQRLRPGQRLGSELSSRLGRVRVNPNSEPRQAPNDALTIAQCHQAAARADLYSVWREARLSTLTIALLLALLLRTRAVYGAHNAHA